jgi:hypothetical protein
MRSRESREESGGRSPGRQAGAGAPERSAPAPKAGGGGGAAKPAGTGPAIGAHEALVALVVLQDLDLMIRDAIDPKQADAVTKMGFKTEGIEGLRAARGAVAAQLDARTLRLYEAAARRYGGRALVPVANRICLGCSAVLPTSLTPDPRRILNCQSCGRILYPL